jgi:hypothetical protein
MAFGSPSAGSGTAVLYYLLFFVFALSEHKNRKIESILLPQALGIHKDKYASIKS